MTVDRIHGAWIAAVLCAGLSACGPSELVFDPAPACVEVDWPTPANGASVVLVVNDTMRRDAAGAYGGRARTPRFDSFAANATLFRNASTQAPWTKPSMATLFTSLHPSQHGMLTHPAPQVVAGQKIRQVHQSDVLSDEFTTLAEVFRAAGFRTAAFVSNPWLDRRFGLAQGFEVYDDSFARFSAAGASVNEAALRWLDGLAPGEKYFLYVHYVDTHRPYPELTWDDLRSRTAEIIEDDRPVSARAREEIGGHVRFAPSAGRRKWPAVPALVELAYERGVEAFDRVFGEFLDEFDARAASSEAMVIVTSDHGEALYERGFGSHGHSLFEEESGVPLVVRVPGVAGSEVSCEVGLIDVMPTLCAHFGVNCPAAVQGQPFVASFAGQATPRYVIAEGVTFFHDHRSIANGRYKLIYEPNGKPQDGAGPGIWSLYDLLNDPHESNNLLPEDAVAPPPNLARMANRLLDAVAPFDAPEAQQAPFDEELEQRLETLGYVDSGGDG